MLKKKFYFHVRKNTTHEVFGIYDFGMRNTKGLLRNPHSKIRN